MKMMKKIKRFKTEIMKKIEHIFFSGNTLYYPGCLTKYVMKDIKKNYEMLLEKMGINYIELGDLENCCGSPAINAGYKEDFINLIKKNYEIFKMHSIKKIITNCPACFYTLNKLYPKYFPKWDIKAEYFTEVMLSAVKKGKIKFKKEWRNCKNPTKITYHDPCHLGRYSNIYNSPRELLELAGYKIIEMKDTKENSMCCGAGGGVGSNNKKLSRKIGDERIKQAIETKVSILSTTCPLCTKHLDFSSKKKIKVKEFSEAMVERIE